METSTIPKETPSTNGHRFAFDDFEVDPANRMLRRDGVEVRLTGKVFDILLVFVQNPGRLLEKDELIERVWPREYVEEGNLARNVSTLRKAIEDSGKEHKYILTVQGRGYRFIGDVVSLPEAQSNESSQAPAKSRPSRRWYWLVALVIAGGLITLSVLYNRSKSTASTNHSPLEQTRLTTGGKATKATISSDGELVAYVEDQNLKVKKPEGSDRVLLDSLIGLSYVALAFSPDGTNLYFSARHNEVSTISLFRIPISGGTPHKLLDEVYGNISFSPDGKKFVFIRRYPELNQNILIIADSDGSNSRRLAISERPNHFDGSPSWSPDGATIVCPTVSTERGFHFVISAVNVADGRVQTIKTRRWAWLSSLVWLNDSRSLLLSAQAEAAVNAQIWELNSATGDTRQLTDDSFIYESLSGTSNGNRFVAIKRRLESHIWVGEQDPTQVTTGFDRYDGLGGVTWDSEGRLLFHSRATGGDAIWRVNAGAPELLTADGGSGFTLSPDGRLLVFQSMESNSLGLSRLDLKTGERKRVTQNSTDMTPSFTPDGKWIVYSHFGEKHSVNMISVEGGEPSKLFDEYRTVSSPTVSPDGKLLAFSFRRTQADELQSGIAVVSLSDRRLLNAFPVDIRFGTIYERPTVQWSPDGQWLYYINYNSGVSNLWKVNATDGQVVAVTKFRLGRVYNFSFSRDGAKLALARGTVESDVLMIQRAPQ